MQENTPAATGEAVKRTWFERFIAKLDNILTLIESICSGTGMVICFIAVCFNVFMRYVIHVPNEYGEEIARYSSILLVYMGISMALRNRSHLGFSSLREMLPGAGPQIVKLIADLITMITFGFLSVVAYKYVVFCHQINQISVSLRLPLWTLYMILCIGFILCTLRSAMLIYNDFLSPHKPPWVAKRSRTEAALELTEEVEQ